MNLVIESRLCCSHRLFIAFLLGACTFILYAQRQILNMTIYCMIDHRSLETSLLESENSTTSDIHQCTRSHSLNSDLMKTKVQINDFEIRFLDFW